MTDSTVPTVTGKRHMLFNNFTSEVTVPKYGYMGAGTFDSTFTENSAGLGSECSPDIHLGYARVTTTNTFDDNVAKVTVEGLFEKENITNSTTIKEVGVTDNKTLNQGTWFCLCRIPDMVKNSSARMRVVMNISVI